MIKSDIISKIDSLISFYDKCIMLHNTHGAYKIAFDMKGYRGIRIIMINCRDKVCYHGRMGDIDDISSIHYINDIAYDRDLGSIKNIDVDILAHIYFNMHAHICKEIESLPDTEHVKYTQMGLDMPEQIEPPGPPQQHIVKKKLYKVRLLEFIVRRWPMYTPKCVTMARRLSKNEGDVDVLIWPDSMSMGDYNHIKYVHIRNDGIAMGICHSEHIVKLEEDAAIDNLIKLLEDVAMDVANNVRLKAVQDAIHDENAKYVRSAVGKL